MVLIFVLGCDIKKDEKLRKSVIKDFKLAENTQNHLFRMYSSVASNPEADELAFSNFVSPIRIVITDYNGKLVETVGKEGRGPKEILSARYFGFDNQQNLVILDKRNAKFKKYNRSTGEVKSYTYEMNKGLSVTSRNLQLCSDKWYMGVQLMDRSTEIDVPIIGVFDTQFNIVDTLGGYDPFFNGRKGILQEPNIKIDCKNRRIYTIHGKIPYIQVFSMDDGTRIARTTAIPASFKISDKFITVVTNEREWQRYLSKEQSISLKLAYTDKYIYHFFSNSRNVLDPKHKNRTFLDRDHFVAVYDKKSLQYLGETKMPGPVLGSIRKGSLIVLKNETTSEIQFVNIEPVSVSSD